MFRQTSVHRATALVCLFAGVGLPACDAKTDGAEAEPAKEEPAKEEPKKEEPAKGEPEKAEAPKGDPPPAADAPDIEAQREGALADVDAKSIRKLPDSDHEVFEFKAHAVAVGDVVHQLAVWSDDADPSTIHLALFEGKPGEWMPKWVERDFVAHDTDVEEGVLPAALQIGPKKWAILWSPAVEGCGAEECSAEDDYIDNVLYEIQAAGPKEIWTFHGPGCGTEELHPIAPDQCRVAFEPGPDGAAESDAFTLVLDAVRDGKKSAQKLSFEGGRYLAAK